MAKRAVLLVAPHERRIGPPASSVSRWTLIAADHFAEAPRKINGTAIFQVWSHDLDADREPAGCSTDRNTRGWEIHHSGESGPGDQGFKIPALYSGHHKGP